MEAQEENSTAESPALFRAEAVPAGNRGVGMALAVVFFTALFFSALTALWLMLDHHFPSADEAGHILNSLAMRDLLLRPRPWNPNWWHQCFTVNCYYPPMTYFVNGFLSIFTEIEGRSGASRLAQIISESSYTLILSISTYWLARLVKGGVLAGIAAMAVINLYPAVAYCAHSYMLDLPMVSMVSLSLATLLFWQKRPGFKRAVLCGVVLGAACLTKQLVAAYVFPAGAFLLLKTLLSKDSARFSQVGQLFLIAAITASIGAPYLAANIGSIKAQSHYNLTTKAELGVHYSFLQYASCYLKGMWSAVSPIALFWFAVSLFRLKGEQQARLLPVTLSAVFGLLALSSLAASMPSCRYAVPSLILPALYSGLFAESVIVEGGLFGRVAAMLVALLLCVNYFWFSFVPACQPSLPSSSSAAASDRSSGTASLMSWISPPLWNRPGEPDVEHFSPVKDEDWGLVYTIEAIEKRDKEQPVFLNILTNSARLNAHSFELLVKELHSRVRPTTSRVWTIMGDKVNFTEKSALDCQWYLLKSGDTGFHFFDDDSRQNLARLERFVRESGRFIKMGEKALPDGTELELYRINY